MLNLAVFTTFISALLSAFTNYLTCIHIMQKIWVPTSQRTSSLSIINTKCLTQFKELIAACCENHLKYNHIVNSVLFSPWIFNIWAKSPTNVLLLLTAVTSRHMFRRIMSPSSGETHCEEQYGGQCSSQWVSPDYGDISPLKTKRICFIQGLSEYRAVNTLHFGYKNQSLNVL
jgi:hypothetical protein